MLTDQNNLLKQRKQAHIGFLPWNGVVFLRFLQFNNELLVSKVHHTAVAAAAKSLQSCLTLYDPIDGSPPGSSVPGILQARILEWVASSFSKACMHAKSLQSCPTLYYPMDSSPPGSSVHGILQAKALEWVARFFSDTAVKNQEIIWLSSFSLPTAEALFSCCLQSRDRLDPSPYVYWAHPAEQVAHPEFFVPGRCQPVWPLYKEWLVFPWKVFPNEDRPRAR